MYIGIYADLFHMSITHHICNCFCYYRPQAEIENKGMTSGANTYTVELGYNLMKGTEYFVSLKRVSFNRGL